jgi:hypothetical protein
MADTGRRVIGDVSWIRTGDTWEARHGTGFWWISRHRRRDGHVSRNGWYLNDWASDHLQWAGSTIDHALKIATLLALGEWWRTGLREPDGTPTWRNAAGDVKPEPELLADLKVTHA